MRGSLSTLEVLVCTVGAGLLLGMSGLVDLLPWN